jgi:hypothetical protein
LGKRSIALLVTVATFALSFSVATPAMARGGHGGSGSSSVSLVLVDSTDGVAHAGQQVTFDVATTATASPFVSLNCYQNGVWVYTASAGFFSAYPWSRNFTLSSTAWMSGEADCTARLYSTKTGTRTTTLATTSFHVNP